MTDPTENQRSAPPEQSLLIVRNIVKRFGPTVALDDVSVSFRAGEVHALMGENGAGKSTLGKVIAGLHRPDSGRVILAGRELEAGSIDDAFAAGVRIVHQELAQCPNLSVAENLCLHDLPRRAGVLVDRRAMARRATRLLLNLEPAIDVQRPLGSLSPGHRQIVQIASALDDRAAGSAGATDEKAGARVIVFDEPTSSLSIAEVERLFAIIRRLAAQGITIIYVSHRMAEIFEICDRVTVLRDGKFVATSPTRGAGAIDEPALVEQMIGRRIETPVRASASGSGWNGTGGEAAALRAIARGAVDVEGSDADASERKPLLEVRGVSSPGRLRDISLRVAPGEVLGIGGLVGAGRSELLDAIFGLDAAATGTVLVDGKSLNGKGSPREAIRAGVGYVPEDRKLQGLCFQLGADENIVLPVMGRLARALGVRSWRAERMHVSERMSTLRVKAAWPWSLPGELSGGNQQKLLIARWMGRGTRVLLLDEPTRGIDVGTKAEIYKLVREAAEQHGTAIVLVSSEMPELLALSDRIVVLCEGRLTGELRGEAMTQANILRLATASERSRAMAG